MKKIVLVVLFCCLTLGLTACGSNSKPSASSTTKSTEKSLSDPESKKETDKLEALGLTTKQAKGFYLFTHAVKFSILGLENIDSKLEDQDYTIKKEDQDSVMAALSVASDSFNDFAPSSASGNFEKFLNSEKGAPSPKKVLGNCEQYKRHIGDIEAYILMKNFGIIVNDTLVEMDISDADRKNLIEYYITSIEYKGIFKEVKEQANEAFYK